MMMMGKKEARNRAMPSQNARPGSDSFSTHDYQLNQQEETKKKYTRRQNSNDRQVIQPIPYTTKIRSDSLSTAQLVVLKNERKEKTNEIIFFRL
jgi:hypothetical protein